MKICLQWKKISLIFFISNEEDMDFSSRLYFFDAVCVRGISVPIREKMWL